MKSPWWPQWRAACDREMANHKELGTWSLVPITQVPSDCQVLDMKMFGKVKRGPDGKVKVRELTTWSPVPPASFRIVHEFVCRQN